MFAHLRAYAKRRDPSIQTSVAECIKQLLSPVLEVVVQPLLRAPEPDQATSLLEPMPPVSPQHVERDRKAAAKELELILPAAAQVCGNTLGTGNTLTACIFYHQLTSACA